MDPDGLSALVESPSAVKFQEIQRVEALASLSKMRISGTGRRESPSSLPGGSL